jgi:hypothetical protein
MLMQSTNIHMYGVIMLMQYELKSAHFLTSTLYNKRTCYIGCNAKNL